MGWQWNQLDHMQIICTLLQTDNHASTSPLISTCRMPFRRPTNSVKALKAPWWHVYTAEWCGQKQWRKKKLFKYFCIQYICYITWKEQCKFVWSFTTTTSDLTVIVWPAFLSGISRYGRSPKWKHLGITGNCFYRPLAPSRDLTKSVKELETTWSIEINQGWSSQLNRRTRQAKSGHVTCIPATARDDNLLLFDSSACCKPNRHLSLSQTDRQTHNLHSFNDHNQSVTQSVCQSTQQQNYQLIHNFP